MPVLLFGFCVGGVDIPVCVSRISGTFPSPRLSAHTGKNACATKNLKLLRGVDFRVGIEGVPREPKTDDSA